MDRIYHLDNVGTVSGEVWDIGQHLPVWLFSGSPGAGKTTFIRSLCDHIGVESHVCSPTYSIVNEYRRRGGEEVYHMDFFRVRNALELLHIGIEEYFLQGRLCLVEWPEIAAGLLPANHLKVLLEVAGECERKIQIKEQS